MIDEETVFAYIDGELEGEERARVEAAIAADPALQDLVAGHRALKARLDRAFATVLDEPVSGILSTSPTGGGEVHSLEAARSRRDERKPSWNLSHWMAMAATLVAGVMGGVLFTASDDGPVRQRGDALLASGALENALDTQLASSQSATAPVRIGLTFRDRDSAICRSFAAESIEGVACRRGGAWRLEGLHRRPETRAGEYRMASSSAVADLVDGLIAGEPMDAAQEQAALAAGWAPSQAQ